jgi:hypothetical protein
MIRAYTGEAMNILENGLPSDFALSVFPNPFNSAVTISVGQTGMSNLRTGRQTGMSNERALPIVEIFDLAGKIVATPCGDPLSPLSRGTDTNAKHEGQGVFIWQPASSVPSGVYLVRAKTGNSETTKRVVYLK